MLEILSYTLDTILKGGPSFLTREVTHYLQYCAKLKKSFHEQCCTFGMLRKRAMMMMIRMTHSPDLHTDAVFIDFWF